jgi:hypothetical protein
MEDCGHLATEQSHEIRNQKQKFEPIRNAYLHIVGAVIRSKTMSLRSGLQVWEVRSGQSKVYGLTFCFTQKGALC